ncbi:hypothetical protein [Marinobacter salsuginis]|jgi:hypothetical protein|uniref:Uncharacterized protein n=1 Tax=Marinobacter salsuginis TaxID=418719 RepID=A0A5M3Q2I7_9GAMM|nr:hypothetical protein [Marinobacter salsuginis]GBO89241.1 hypothetical protein MSSD14B_29090 [Marinobacter salsuginis]
MISTEDEKYREMEELVKRLFKKRKNERSPDPNAPRKYKKLNVPFNEFEYGVLETAANNSGRSKLNFIRWAILKAAEEIT